MLIENPDAFKSWLTSVLEPLCDADPEALAKYVFALVKKDKTADVLRQGMLEQLDVFLQSETKPFVEMLFKTLETQEYLMPVIPNANPPNPHVPTLVVAAKKDTITGSGNTSPADQLLVKEMKPIIPVSTLPNLSESINGSVPAASAAGAAVTGGGGGGGGIVVKKDSGGDSTGPVIQKPSQPLLHRKSDSEKEERGRSGRGRHRSNSRNRSRSRSWERTKRSRSPRSDRSPRGERERRDRSRPWRNKSPPRGSSRYDRRRSRTGSPTGGGGGGGGGGRLRSRSRSPRHTYRGNRYRNRSPPPRSMSRSRSRSNDRMRSEKDNKKDSKVSDSKDMLVGKDENSGGATPTQDSNHGDTDMRLTSTTQSIQSVVSALNPSSAAAAPGTNAGPPPGAPKRRCRDFDEKGYCMRGEMCPYDHGVDPVVLEDTALSRVLTFGPGGPNGAAPGVVNVDGAPLSAPPGLLHHHHHAHPAALLPGGPGVPPPPPPGAVLQHMTGGPPVNIPTGVRVSGGGGGGHPEYNPSAPGMHWLHRPGGFRGPPRPMMPRGMPQMGGGPFQPLPSMQRELINVQVTDNTHGTSNTNTGPGGGGGGGGSMAGFKRRADYQHHDGSPDHGLMGIGGVGGGPPAPKRKQGFDFNRLGPRAGKHHANNPVNCSLELKKVPRGLNNITHLNNHFSKFGKIVNIQVCYDGDPEGAIVTFSSHAEANAAYRSTEAVLNNRFIKVFWHSSSGGLNNNNNMDRQENVPPSSSVPVRPVKDRLGQPVCGGNKVLNLVQPKATTTPAAAAAEDDTVVPGESNTTPGAGGGGGGGAGAAAGSNNSEDEAKAAAGGNSVYVPSSMKRDQEQSRALANAAIVKSQEILAAKEQLKKKHEEKRKEALKITQDLRKRKQELLEKQLAQQKLLIEKLEKTNPTGQQRELLMTTIKTVQESIESIRKDMMSTASPAKIPAPGAAAGPVGPARKSREEAQREVLDAELDLITKQAEGGDTSELQRRLLELRAQAYTLTRGGGPAGPGVRGGGARGGGGGRRGRGPARALLSKNNLLVDNNNRNSVGHTRGGRGGGGGGGAVPGGAVFQKHTVVDHRPTRLLVSGYEGDESDSVLAHFAQYGEIIDYVTDSSTPSIVLNYKTRKEAEMALLKGKNFQDRTLSVTWCTSPQRSMQRSNSISSGTGTGTAGRAVLLSETTTEDQLLEGGDDETVLNEPLGGTELSEEALLQDDEEEEDENEDRSWRR